MRTLILAAVVSVLLVGSVWAQSEFTSDAIFFGPTTSQTIELFDDITVGDTTDGFKLRLYRVTDGEGTETLDLYIDQFQRQIVEGSVALLLRSTSGNVVIGSDVSIGEFIVDNYTFQHEGALTGPGNKYVEFVVNDATDTYELTREDSNILGFDVQMPLSGGVNIRTDTDGSHIVTAREARGGVMIADNATATSDTDYTLPSAEEGMSACFYDFGGGNGGIDVDPQSGDTFVLDGTTLDAGDRITSPAAGDDGDFICILAISDATWVTLGMKGTWTDGGA